MNKTETQNFPGPAMVRFVDLPLGTQFEFRGRRYEKMTVCQARDEERCGNLFHNDTQVFAPSAISEGNGVTANYAKDAKLLVGAGSRQPGQAGCLAKPVAPMGERKTAIRRWGARARLWSDDCAQAA